MAGESFSKVNCEERECPFVTMRAKPVYLNRYVLRCVSVILGARGDVVLTGMLAEMAVMRVLSGMRS